MVSASSEGKPAVERRLGVIMFTDMVGYSSLSQKDEGEALRLLDEYRGLVTSIFPKYGGRVVKTIGDGFLVELASAVEALKCALEVQKQMKSAPGRDGRVMLRIGIHLGDIVHSGGDILGDAVNVASRVEPLAEPGGICITRQVADHVRGKVRCQLVSLGLRDLKNIQNPVEIYKVLPMATIDSSPERNPLDTRRVAVLPLANMSPDPNDRYFADGMTEELIATISRIGELNVISRTSVMRYRDTALPIGQIAQELGAGSILEGSIRKAGNRIRVTAQLIQAENDRHAWSQTYDRELSDVFAIQSDIAERVAEALKVHLLTKERQIIEKKATSSPEAHSLYLKGRFYWNERTEEAVRKSIKYFEEAVRIDPDFAVAYSGLADAYMILSDYGWMDSDEVAPLAERYASRAVAIDDSLAEAHASLGLMFSDHKWDFASAEREFKKAIELSPNYSAAYHWYAILLQFLGRFGDANAMVKREKNLDPYSRVANLGIGVDLYYLRRFDEALEQLEQVIGANPDFQAPRFWKALTCVQTGRFAEAIDELKKRLTSEKRVESANDKLVMAWTCARAGDRESAGKLVDAVAASGAFDESPAWGGMAKFALGMKDEAFALFLRACELHDATMLYLRVAPAFDDVRADPRWAELEKRVGLPEASDLGVS